MLQRFFLTFALLVASVAAQAQTFPPLTGRVVDTANILDPTQEQALTAKLEAIEDQSGRQVVVATLADLQGYDIADYGYRLGRTWGIGQKGEDNGALLIVAPGERKVRIEVGYGLEGILTDAMSSIIIQRAIIPHFKQDDYPGGIAAGVNEIGKLLALPPDEARARALEAEQQAEKRHSSGNGFMLFFWLAILLFFVAPIMLGGVFGGRRYGRGRGRGPVVIWGPGIGGGWGGGRSGGGWGGGGFSGGGGGFGGGGASGGW
ncbi:MAG TPA: TPM domain-containing protein [Rhizorhapis sp.]